MNVFVLLLWNLFPIIFFEFINLLYVLEKIISNFNFIHTFLVSLAVRTTSGELSLLVNILNLD